MTPRDEVLGSDDLLIAVFKALPMAMQERQRLLPLVCQRWRRLLVSPALLQQAEMSLSFANRHDLLTRLRSLCAFLQRHAGQHLRVLRLEFKNWLVVEGEAALVIAAGVKACAASLEQVDLQFASLQLPVSWVAGMARLRSLSLGAEDHLSVAADFTPLKRLEELRLTSEEDHVSLAPSAALPPSLTFLSVQLQNPPGHALPPQLSALTDLRELWVGARGVRGHGYELLRGLSALRVLQLLDLDEFPACLSSLVSLESLTICSPSIECQPLAAALPSLSLTQLVLLGATPNVFAALPTQPRLRDFRCWLGDPITEEEGADDEEDADEEEDAGLVGGAWLHGLRRLGLSAWVLEASMPALAHATGLETAQVLDTMRDEELEAVLGWAVQRPALRRLDLCFEWCEDDDGLCGADCNAMLRAQALRPDLRIRIRYPCRGYGMELLAADGED